MIIVAVVAGAASLTNLQNKNASAVLAPSQHRLQRAPDFTGARLDTFKQVALRHGLPGAVLGVLCLCVPEMRMLLADGLADMRAAPAGYFLIGVAIFGCLIGYAWFLDRRIDAAAVGWMLYLLAVSIWEEWVFRLAIPYFGEAQGVALMPMVLVSNLFFGVVHFFTLRWKWYWCLGAFLGGVALSRNVDQHFDLALVIAIHWVATYINTPRLPGGVSVRALDP